MKKLLISLTIFALFSCNRDENIDPIFGTEKCAKASDKYLADLNVWSSDIDNKAKCEAVKKSLTELLSKCSTYTAIQRKEYEEELKNFTCE